MVASPATVSRVGIIYMEPRGLGLDALCQSWLAALPESLPVEVTTQFCVLFDTYLSSGQWDRAAARPAWSRPCHLLILMPFDSRAGAPIIRRVIRRINTL